MTTDDALTTLGQSTAEAIAGVLAMFCGDAVQQGGVTVASGEQHPLTGVPVPAVAASVSYVDGVTGGNVFVMSVEGARKLAAAMMGGMSETEEGAPELSELELSAVGEAMNQMMAAAAGATGATLGQEVEIDPPQTRVFAAGSEMLEAYEPTPHATSTSFNVLGEACRLVQFVPHAFTVRMMRALDEGAAESTAGTHTATDPETALLGDKLRGVQVRVWAELGRARLPLGKVVELPPGAIVDLDRDAEEPVELFVNGLAFARGRLVVAEGGEWAIRIDTVLDAVAGALAGEAPDALAPGA